MDIQYRVEQPVRALVLITDAFGGQGGIAKFNRDVLTAMCSHPHCMEVVAIPRLMPNPTGPLPSRLAYVTEGLNGKLRYVFTGLKSLYRNAKFSLIVCGHINLLPLAYAFRLWIKAPLALIIHGIEAWQPTRRWLTDHLARRVDALISVSNFTMQRFLGWARGDIARRFILPDCIDLERYGAGTKNLELLNRYGLTGKTVLMTLGRLSEHEKYKGFDEILELMPALIKEIPTIAYLIVGDGTDRHRLEEKARSLGVHEFVVFAGYVPESEKADHYRLADAYVMPGRGEGFGIVYLEALACGVPVVASEVDGGREAVRDGALGILVDPRDAKDIKRGILEALAQPKGVVLEGLEYFSYANFEQRAHHIIDKVLASP